MKVDEKRESALTNFKSVTQIGRAIESDHNPVILELNLIFEAIKPERREIFQFKDKAAQLEFKRLTTDTKDFTNCFNNELDFEVQASNWRNSWIFLFTKLSKTI